MAPTVSSTPRGSVTVGGVGTGEVADSDEVMDSFDGPNTASDAAEPIRGPSVGPVGMSAARPRPRPPLRCGAFGLPPAVLAGVFEGPMARSDSVTTGSPLLDLTATPIRGPHPNNSWLHVNPGHTR